MHLAREWLTIIFFYRFPQDSEIKRQWVIAVKRIKSDRTVWEPKSSDYICSKHFKETDYVSSAKRRKLRPVAVPSIFPHRPRTSSSERSVRYVSSYGQVPVIVNPTVSPPSSSKEDTLKRKLVDLTNNIRNTKKREKRLRATVACLKDQLLESKKVNKELAEKLDAFAGKVLIDFYAILTSDTVLTIWRQIFNCIA